MGTRSGLKRRRAITWIWTCAFCILATFLSFAPSAWAMLGEVSRTQLPNGLTLVLKEYRKIPIANFLLILPGGASQEATNKAGLASLAADLLLKGTTERNASQISEEIDFLGGSLSAGANYDYCSISLEVLSKDIDRGLDLLLDCLLHPTFPQEELDRQRAQALAALSQANEDPGTIIERKFRSLLYRDHPYGHPLNGTRQSLASIQREDVEAFYRRFFLPNQAILVVVGDFDAAGMAEKLRALFSPWAQGELKMASVPPPASLRGRRVILIDKPDVTQAQIFMGNIGVPRDTPRYFPLSLANGILGRMGFSSRLMDQIRANLGLTYSIDSHFSMGKAGGSFVIETSTQNGNVGKAISAILEQVRIFREGGLSPEELAKVKTYKKGIYYIALERAGALVAQLADVAFYGLPLDYIDTYQKRIEAVTLEEANSAARDLFPYDSLLIAVLGDGEKIQGQLQDLGLGELQIERFQPE